MGADIKHQNLLQVPKTWLIQPSVKFFVAMVTSMKFCYFTLLERSICNEGREIIAAGLGKTVETSIPICSYDMSTEQNPW